MRRERRDEEVERDRRGIAVKDIDTKIDTMTNAKRYKQKDKEKGDSGRDKHTHKQTQRQKQIVTKKS